MNAFAGMCGGSLVGIIAAGFQASAWKDPLTLTVWALVAAVALCAGLAALLSGRDSPEESPL